MKMSTDTLSATAPAVEGRPPTADLTPPYLYRMPFRRQYSRHVLFQMFVLGALAAGLLLWNFDFLRNVYLENQLTNVGWLINGGIVALFLLGLARIVALLRFYQREEQALEQFVEDAESGMQDPADRAPASLITSRFDAMRALHEASVPTDQGALAATLTASESTRASVPKFIANILILTGVFGTIVALSMALIGASNLIGADAADVTGMGMVVHGMSTALSTTMTAILCYLFLGYFYLRLTDVQTNLVAGIEHVTTHYLVPRFHVTEKGVTHQLAGLIRSLQSVVGQIAQERASLLSAEERLFGAVTEERSRQERLAQGLEEIQDLLREGFRLPDQRP
ncbi:hypothetical protein HUS23_13105 [Ectothiorhodospiraceae bacterium 2226]|nr:hypothetical protein HUS23_13105 [Ectothiorhodospiraceae bacterium 2226]